VSAATATALYTLLKGTSAITSKLGAPVAGMDKAIYEDQAPSGAAFPYIIFSKVTGTKVRAMQAPEAFKRETWLVKAVDRSTSSNLADEVASAIDAVLDGGTLAVSGKTVADLHHVGDVKYLEADGDQQYKHSGGNYRAVLTAP
jgi:hypothetical protein